MPWILCTLSMLNFVKKCCSYLVFRLRDEAVALMLTFLLDQLEVKQKSIPVTLNWRDCCFQDSICIWSCSTRDYRTRLRFYKDSIKSAEYIGRRAAPLLLLKSCKESMTKFSHNEFRERKSESWERSEERGIIKFLYNICNHYVKHWNP